MQNLQREKTPSDRNGFEWGVAAFAAGIGIYFSLAFEPRLLWIGAVLPLLTMVYVSLRQRTLIAPLVVGILLIALGLGRAAWHTQAANSYRLPEARSAYTVTGWIETIERSGKGFRWRIRVTEFEGYRKTPAPYRVRIRAKTEGFAVGDGVSVRALMTGPPGPVVPGGYDPAKRAYFQKLGGYGFAIANPEAVEVEGGGLARRVAKLRYSMAKRILERAPPDTAGLQAALLTGVRAYIPPEQTDALRDAGLAHVLAISGLHMGLLAGGAYGFMTLILATIAPLSRRYDVRKFAAVIGILAASAYLMLSGGSVSTQRAYIMAVIVFLAVILDRRALSIRSVALAAIITLLLHPESLISAGFQMSFAAVTALVVVYRRWDNLNKARYRGGFIKRTSSGFVTLSVTSIVAGAATDGFAILHFNRFVRYGVAGNLLAMPVFTAIVMPAALVSLVLMPLGLEAMPLQVMGWGLDFVLFTATQVAGWDGAVAHIASAPGWVIGIYGIAFLLLCLGNFWQRALSIVLMAVCVGGWMLTPQPDMRVSDTGRVAFWSKDALYVSSQRADRYGKEQFMQRAGRVDANIQSYQGSEALCDALACRMEVKGKTISVISQPSEVPESCRTSDIVVLTQRRAGPVARRNCEAILIDDVAFRKGGAHDIYLGNNIRVERAMTKARGARPWGKRY